MIYLYLKTHNKTGYQYLGKTISDPFKYKGSGLLWTRHLKKHGNDVTTEILFQSADKEEFKQKALEISKKLNIVESINFANLCYESGQGGNTYNRTGKKRPGGHREHYRSGHACVIDGVEYISVSSAAKELGEWRNTIKHRITSPYWPSYQMRS